MTDEASYVLVPREPTEAMIEAAVATPGMLAVTEAMTMHQARGYEFSPDSFPGNVSPLNQAWTAMLAAAPSATAQSPTPDPADDTEYGGAIRTLAAALDDAPPPGAA